MERFGRYELLGRIANGGMAEVHLARPCDSAARLVVLKRIHPHLAQNRRFVRMFLGEARIAARLAHPQVVQVVDLGRVGQSLFLAMEFIHGEDLRRVTRRASEAGRPLPLPLSIFVVAEACAGLDYAHEKRDDSGRPLGIVHRDVSPQNLLVTFDGTVKVIDFGIAKAADSAQVTLTGEIKGKYAYMSPEQADGAKLDRRCDVFALGVVLWELLTGERLFKRSTDAATLEAVRACEVPPPSTLVPGVPPGLDAVVLRALARDAEARIPSADALRRALVEVLAACALPGSRLELRRFVREIYAERLAAEASAGRPLPPGLAAASRPAPVRIGPPEKVPAPPPRPPAPVSTAPLHARSPAQTTRLHTLPPVPVPARQGRARRWRTGLAALVGLAALAVAAVLLAGTALR